MTEDEITRVVAKLSSNWGRWNDEVVSEWWDNLRAVPCAVADALDAAQALVNTEHYRPQFADFRSEALRFKRDREIHEAEARAIAAPPTDRDREREAGRAGVVKVRAVMAELPSFADVNRTRGHDHRNGTGGCKVCARHDHSDTRTIGFGVAVTWYETPDGRKRVEHGEPIPAWHMVCPRCGAEFPDLVCDAWTPVGAQLMRELRATRTAGDGRRSPLSARDSHQAADTPGRAHSATTDPGEDF